MDCEPLSPVERFDLAAMTRVGLKKISGFFPVDDAVTATFDDVCKESVTLAPDTVIVEQGGRYSDIFLIDNGWVLRSRYLPNGTRQIVNVAMPGDFAALNAMLFDVSDFELTCKTEVTAFRFDADALYDRLFTNPRLGAALCWVNAQEESMLAEKIVSLGRRSARARTAHVLCEFIARLEIIGVEDVNKFAIPLSQEEFSDILGTSVVHTNKTLRSLERDGIISFRNSLLMLMNRKGLEIEAGFDDGYLHFTRRPDARTWPKPALVT